MIRIYGQEMSLTITFYDEHSCFLSRSRHAWLKASITEVARQRLNIFGWCNVIADLIYDRRSFLITASACSNSQIEFTFGTTIWQDNHPASFISVLTAIYIRATYFYTRLVIIEVRLSSSLNHLTSADCIDAWWGWYRKAWLFYVFMLHHEWWSAALVASGNRFVHRPGSAVSRTVSSSLRPTLFVMLSSSCSLRHALFIMLSSSCSLRHALSSCSLRHALFVMLSSSCSLRPALFVMLSSSCSLRHALFIMLSSSCSLRPALFVQLSSSCSLRPALFVMLSSSSSLRHALFVMLSSSCSLRPALFVMLSSSCSLRHALFVMLSSSCSLRHALFVMLSSSCSLRHALFVMLSSSCSLRHALAVSCLHGDDWDRDKDNIPLFINNFANR